MRLHGCVRGCSPVWLQGERDWLHANSVDWTLGPDGVGYVLVSYNVPSEVVVVRWPTADELSRAPPGAAESGILFRFGNPLVARTGNPNPNPDPDPNPNPNPNTNPHPHPHPHPHPNPNPNPSPNPNQAIGTRGSSSANTVRSGCTARMGRRAARCASSSSTMAARRVAAC